MKKLYFLFSLIIFTCFNLHGQTLKGGGEKYPDLHTNERALQKWQALRFGMFVHWGPVSLKGTEIGWSRGADVPFEEYDNLYKKFDPENFNAAEWIGLMKDAGMKYLIIVSKVFR